MSPLAFILSSLHHLLFLYLWLQNLFLLHKPHTLILARFIALTFSMAQIDNPCYLLQHKFPIEKAKQNKTKFSVFFLLFIFPTSPVCLLTTHLYKHLVFTRFLQWCTGVHFLCFFRNASGIITIVQTEGSKSFFLGLWVL